MVSLIRDIVIAALVTAGLVALISAVASPPPASAQEAAAFRTLRQACAGDVRKLCPGVAPGDGRIKKCLAEKSDQVSQACKEAVAGKR